MAAIFPRKIKNVTVIIRDGERYTKERRKLRDQHLNLKYNFLINFRVYKSDGLLKYVFVKQNEKEIHRFVLLKIAKDNTVPEGLVKV